MASAAAEPALLSADAQSRKENATAGVYRGVYNADPNTTIVCFGDLEGTSLRKLLKPAGAKEESNTGVLLSNVSNLAELYQYLSVGEDGELVIQPNVMLVCLGDVIGDGPDNIELATTLLNLKDKYPTRVVIITGNRDLNKLRLDWELAPTDACMAELRTKVNSFVDGNLQAFDGFVFSFKRNEEADFDYMWDTHSTQISEKKECLKRVLYITEETLNEYYGWVFLVDEYLTKKGFTPEVIGRISLGDKSYIYVYLVQAMAGAIDCGVPAFNGIFKRLLMNGHLIACIDAGERGKFGFMHSLPPRGKIPTTPGAIYKEQYDKGIAERYLSDEQQKKNVAEGNVKDSEITAQKVDINVGLHEFNQSLRTLIHTSRSDRKIWRQLLEWVSGMTSGSYWTYKNNRISGANMPLSTVSFGTGFEQIEAASGITVQSGGTIVNLKDSIATQYIDINDFTRVVCSHSPKGYVGVKVMTTNGKTYYCIDVSKIDDQEYDVKERFGCCFLILEFLEGKVRDKFIGRIMLKQSQFPKDYNIFTGRKEDTTVLEGSKFACRNPMFANYVLSPIPTSTKTKMEQRLPLKIENKDYVFEYIVKSREEVEKNRADKIRMSKKTFGYVTKTPTLTAVAAAGGGSRTRKRRSRYLKKSARTTHKRRISKKLAQKNNKRKDKKSIRK